MKVTSRMRERVNFVSNQTLRFGHFQCPYVCAADPRSEIESLLSSLAPDQILFLTDQQVDTLYGSRVAAMMSVKHHVTKLIIPSGESQKTLTTVERLCEKAIDTGATRRTLIVALGGGVVGNIAGVVAGLLFRGIHLLHMPTTLLAASDSVISLKQAVNGTKAKNTFGLFHEPCGIIVDCSFMTTLPSKEIRSGLAELIKNGLIIAPETIGTLLSLIDEPPPWTHQTWSRLIELGVDAKCRVMAEDPFELQAALILEYGHTVGHAIEFLDARMRGEAGLTHGECVTIGMRVAARVAVRMGFASPSLVRQHDSIIAAAGLACPLPEQISISTLLNTIRYDNKRGKAVSAADETLMVLLEDLGRPVLRANLPLVPVPCPVLRTALHDLASTA